jgi:hypothetical protein
MEKKVCSKCKEEKEVCEFGKRKDSKDGFNGKCKNCIKITHKSWRDRNPNKYPEYNQKFKVNNPDSFRLKSKKYRQNNKEKIEEYNRQWRQNNKKYINEYMINKRKNDSQYHLITLVRCRLHEFLKFRKITKRNTTEEIIGCTKEFLKEHIEKQFTKGMSWELIGKHIHIDHIIPLSSAKTEEEVYKLCHYTNLQPLWAEDNLKKSNKLL